MRPGLDRVQISLVGFMGCQCGDDNNHTHKDPTRHRRPDPPLLENIKGRLISARVAERLIRLTS